MVALCRSITKVLSSVLIAVPMVGGGRLLAQGAGSVQGTVIGAAQQPLEGATVMIVGGRAAGRTSALGRYILAGVPAGTYTLRAQSIGYGATTKQVTVTAGQAATVDFELEQVALALDQIVVTGTAGEHTRLSQPAQVGVLDAEKMMLEAPKVDVANVLQSKLAGVSVTQGSGTTGSAPRIRIRGASSISLSNEPLIFIDGVRADSRIGSSAAPGGGNGSKTNAGGQGVSRMNDLNPDDIESIEVVKGPAAATLYGADASAGVIQIITKKGSAGAFRSNVSAEVDGIDANWRPPDNWGKCTQALIDKGTPICQGLAANTLVSDNPLLRDKVIKRGTMSDLNWSGSGGAETFRYFLSAGVNNETGVLPSNSQSRKTARINSTMTIRPDLTVDAGFGLFDTYTRQPDNNHSVYGYGAGAGIGDPLTLGTPSNGWFGGTRHSDQIAAIKNVNQAMRSLTTVAVRYQPASWLSQRLTVGADLSNEERVKMVPKNDSNYYQASDNPGFVHEVRTGYRAITLDYLANATRAFGANQAWNAELALGSQVVVTREDVVEADGTGLATNAARVVGATAQTTGTQTFQDIRSVGYLGQAQIGFKDRIFVQTGLRVDRNSSFGTSVGSIFLPKVGASWVLAKEPFVQRHLPSFSQLRLRAAYGVTGRAPLAGTALETWSPSPVAQSGSNQPGLDLLNPGNPDLRPERGSEFEGGVDAGFLNNRVGLELTYFRKMTHDLILQRQLPTSVGYAQNPYVNIGAVENRGLEAVVTGNLIDRGRNTWDMRVSMNTLHNELTDLGGIPAFGTSSRFNKGYPLSAFFSRVVKSVDVANNRAVVSDTLEYVGSQFPSFEGNVNSNMTLLGNWHVTANFDWKAGNTLLNSTNEYRDRSVVRNREAIDQTLLSDEARLRRFGPYVDLEGKPVTANAVEEPYFEKADFIRFRELAVTYNLSPSLSSRLTRSQRASIVVGGRNLGLWTKYSGSDPETISDNTSLGNQFSTTEFFNFPPSRRFFVRINLSY
jgi:TonB-linked SusC/RagA family outer membrane protein